MEMTVNEFLDLFLQLIGCIHLQQGYFLSFFTCIYFLNRISTEKKISTERKNIHTEYKKHFNVEPAYKKAGIQFSLNMPSSSAI